jgi:hypothetical protein
VTPAVEQVRSELFTETKHTAPVDFHSFRRAFATALAGSGVNVQTAMVLAGHSDARTHLGYVALAAEQQPIPAAALPRLTPRKGIVPPIVPAETIEGDGCRRNHRKQPSFSAPQRIRTFGLQPRRPAVH